MGTVHSYLHASFHYFTSSADLILSVICNELGRASGKWYKIGVSMGIPRHVLNQLKKDEDPLSAVIDYWLRGNVTDPVTPISWKSIVAALESNYVGESGLARQIKSKYCQPEDTNEERGKLCDISIP